MPSPFDDVCCARIPRAALPRLASLRVEPGLRGSITEDHAWLRWDAGNERVLRIVMPIHDAQLFRFREERWSQRLPARLCWRDRTLGPREPTPRALKIRHPTKRSRR